jgi:hypothetical protein
MHEIFLMNDYPINLIDVLAQVRLDAGRLRRSYIEAQDFYHHQQQNFEFHKRWENS